MTIYEWWFTIYE